MTVLSKSVADHSVVGRCRVVLGEDSDAGNVARVTNEESARELV